MPAGAAKGHPRPPKTRWGISRRETSLLSQNETYKNPDGEPLWPRGSGVARAEPWQSARRTTAVRRTVDTTRRLIASPAPRRQRFTRTVVFTEQ